jgi:hypothetical protein
MITPDVARRAQLAVRCPHCRAPEGARCTVLSNGRPLRHGTCHPARADALALHWRGAA